ncbi:hypothetical protein PF005_g6006 [Phytophthora fragariae]|nr:hypothetical protein PF003_g33533 [Phytophthora fragariae]KAE9125809.1 hypothetical protein PF007_g6219 [Phytophthora fragariae]KAE9224212.1 hypothetical protein PF005_g6006 [Phytophthora fragariae]KAE9245861.1 hypothetical protein PF004_g5057 [Phytophthora fragariae]
MDETETISSGELARGDRDDLKLQQDNQSADTWHHRQSGNLSASTPTHRRTRLSVEAVQSLDELTEISSIAAVVSVQRWWRRHSTRGQRVAQLHKLCRRHVLALLRRRRTVHSRSKLHAIVLQIIFLGIFTFSTLNGYAHDRLYRFMRATTTRYLETPFVASASGTSKTFADISSPQELYDWLEGPFISIAYSNDAVAASSTLTTNRIIGGIRIGQLRVETFDCSSRVTPFFSWTQASTDNGSHYCYGSSDGDFSTSFEVSDPVQVNSSNVYIFKGLNDTDTDTERSAFFSTMSVSSGQYSLPAPAYSVVLARSSENQATSVLKALGVNGYIDGQTRAVMLDLSLFNAMLRYVVALRFLVELPASGGAIASLSAGVAPLTSSFLLDANHWFTSACHIIVILFYTYFFLDEVLALARSRSRQWQYQAIWQRSNLDKRKARGKMRPSPLHRRHGSGVRLFGLLCYTCAWLLRLVAMVKRPSELPLDSDKFVPLRPYVETFRASQLALSASICLAWIELLLMLRVSQPVDLLARAVVCAAPQLFVLMVVMALVVMGYASACLVALGAQSSLFQSLPEAVRSLVAILLQTGTGAASGSSGSSALLGFSAASYGEIGHDAAGTSTLRTLLLACFLLFNVFVAANLFLVVVYEGYLKAKREIDGDLQRLRAYQRGKGVSREEDDRLEAAPMHLDLRLETVEYGRVLAAKLLKILPRRLKMMTKWSKAPEMQSSVLPADVDISPSKHSPSDDDDDDDDDEDDRFSAKYDRGSSSSPEPIPRHNRGGSRERSDNTMLLQGMVLQLALQNEALLRAVNELKQDVQGLQRGGDMSISDRDVLRRGSAIPTIAARARKQHRASVASSGSALVTIPDSRNNQLL